MCAHPDKDFRNPAERQKRTRCGVTRFREVFVWMGTHSVFPIVMCKITVGSNTTASAPIPVVLCAASPSTAITGLVAMVSTSSIILESSIVLTCPVGSCNILHINGLHNRFHFLQLWSQLLLGFLHRVGHMIHRFLHNPQSLCLDLVLLQGFL